MFAIPGAHISAMKKVIAFVVVALVIGGCQTNPISGRAQFMLISEDYAISESKTAYAAMLNPLAEEGKIVFGGTNRQPGHARCAGRCEERVQQ